MKKWLGKNLADVLTMGEYGAGSGAHDESFEAAVLYAESQHRKDQLRFAVAHVTSQLRLSAVGEQLERGAVLAHRKASLAKIELERVEQVMGDAGGQAGFDSRPSLIRPVDRLSSRDPHNMNI
jgi:hypothetical protein